MTFRCWTYLEGVKVFCFRLEISHGYAEELKRAKKIEHVLQYDKS